MSEHEKIVAALERIEQNQTKALQMQAEQIAMARAQMEKTDAKVKESIELQQIAVKRQARAMALLLPAIAIVGALAMYLTFRH
jgi:hypothetical protein